MYEVDNTDFDWFDLEANEEMKDTRGIDKLLADALMEQDKEEQKEINNEFCINSLKTSGWLNNHNEQIRKNTIAEVSKEIRMLYGNEYEKKIRETAINEFADKMIIMMSGHRQDILAIADKLKEQK